MNKKVGILIGVGAALLLILSFIIGSMTDIQIFGGDEPSQEPLEPSDTAHAIVEAFGVSEEYESYEESSSSQARSSNDFSGIIYEKEENTLGFIAYYDGSMTMLTMMADAPLFSDGFKLYFEDISYFHDETLYYNEAWGMNFNEEDYVELDLTLNEFLDKCEELTPREVDWIAREIIGSVPERDQDDVVSIK